MSCGPVTTTFRILDRHAEWQLDLSAGTTISLGEAIELAQVDPLAVDADALSALMPPTWIARGCGSCEWYLACPGGGVLRYGPRASEPSQTTEGAARCAPPAEAEPSCLGFTLVAGAGCALDLVEPVAVASARRRFAVLDAGRGQILICSAAGERVIASIPCHARGPLAFAQGAILVADRERLSRIELVGLARVELPSAPGPIERLVVAGGRVWAALAGVAGELQLYCLQGSCWRPALLSELAAVAPPTGITAVSEQSACVAVPRGGATPRRVCIDRCGRAVPAPRPPAPPRRAAAGSIETGAPIDSGIPRCIWHRMRVELQLPVRTGAALALATSEQPGELPADEDWQVIDDLAASSSVAGDGLLCDWLVDQPPGRYLHFRITLRGDGASTPRIQRIRLDFPRSASSTRLPGVYREDPIASDFLERFVSLFDASLEDFDRVIERFPALLDPVAAPVEALPWLGTFLDIALDPAWSVETRRAILAEAPELYRRRGTPWALARAIALATGTVPAIRELGSSVPFARAGQFRLGESRLFGRARTRFRLGTSQIGASPLRSYGDPDRDHVAALGWRISVQLPGVGTPEAVERLRRLVDAQKPAHVAAGVRVGREHTLLGVASAVGVDTRLGGLPSPRLGSNTRLRRNTVLASSGSRGGSRCSVGVACALGIQTVLS
jgi:phage tail-like protein